MKQVILVYADTHIDEEKITECTGLIQACDMQVAQCFTQAIKSIQIKTYIGSGKCEEIREYIEKEEIDQVVFAHNLSPLQLRNLELILDVPVMDRTELILTIFEARAQSPIAKLQVESARLKKLLPRLIGANTQLGRQSASGKNKGAGEKQLELDRRRIKARMHEVDRELKQVTKQRVNQRRSRQKSTLPFIALCGYTNAGKSTILNQLLQLSEASDEKQVLAQNMLFATLDTSIRCIHVPANEPFLLSDTVGFVRDLPHELVDAFHSTLEEITYADLILLVLDASDESVKLQMDVTSEVLKDLEANHIPMLTIWNQCDKTSYSYPKTQEGHIYINAYDPHSLQVLLDAINLKLYGEESIVSLYIPYDQQPIYQSLKQNNQILNMEEKEDGIYLQVKLAQAKLAKYQPFLIKL